MHARIKWVQDVMFVAESDTGHALVLDGAPTSGGRNLGMRPMELMALGVGSCSSYDVVTILKKARQEITSCEAEVTAERVDATPAIFESIQTTSAVGCPQFLDHALVHEYSEVGSEGDEGLIECAMMQGA